MSAPAGRISAQPPISVPEPALPTPEAAQAVESAVSHAGVPAGAVTFAIGVLAVLLLIFLYTTDIMRPSSFARRKPVLVAQGEPAMLLILALMVYACSIFGARLAYELLPFPKDLSMLTLKAKAIVSLGGYSLSVPAALVVTALVTRRRLADLCSWKDLALGAGLLAVSAPIVMTAGVLGSWAYQLHNGHAPDPIAHTSIKAILEHRGDGWGLAIIAAAVVGAPIVEEVIYRQLVQTAVLRALNRPWLTVVLAAAGFALIHRLGGAVPWHALVPLFVFGLALGIAYARTGRIAIPIIAHMLFNAGNVAAALWLH